MSGPPGDPLFFLHAVVCQVSFEDALARRCIPRVVSETLLGIMQEQMSGPLAARYIFASSCSELYFAFPLRTCSRAVALHKWLLKLLPVYVGKDVGSNGLLLYCVKQLFRCDCQVSFEDALTRRCIPSSCPELYCTFPLWTG